jgi:5-(carboxyamino)imidazole ribonucleotide synthase
LSHVVAPGGTIGVVGGGQLGRMLGLEAIRLGYRLAILDPDPACPAAAVASHHVVKPLADPDGLRAVGAVSQVVTFETEHVPAALLIESLSGAVVLPRPEQLAKLQDRLLQRALIASLGIAQPRFAPVDDGASLEVAVATIGVPSVLKTRRGGYDGLGQARLSRAADARAAWRHLGEVPSVLEAFVPFDREISVVLARGRAGEVRVYPVADNIHDRGILRSTCVPAELETSVALNAQTIAHRLALALDHVGVLTVEFFLMSDGALLVNEIAPRVHNTGHFTLGASTTSQFEQHVRAICGLPLGNVTPLAPAAMVNLLGELWRRGEPDWTRALEQPGVQLHLYAKREPRPGRKMGHLLLRDADAPRALSRLEKLVRELGAGVA